MGVTLTAQPTYEEICKDPQYYYSINPELSSLLESNSQVYFTKSSILKASARKQYNQIAIMVYLVWVSLLLTLKGSYTRERAKKIAMRNLLKVAGTDSVKIAYTINHEFRSIKARFEGLFLLSVSPINPCYQDWVQLFRDWEKDSEELGDKYYSEDPYLNKSHQRVVKDIQDRLARNMQRLEELYDKTFPKKRLSENCFLHWMSVRIEANRLQRVLTESAYFKKAQ